MPYIPTLLHSQPDAPGSPRTRETAEQLLGGAILRSLAYADVFDYPLTADEIHRRLIGLAATPEAVQEVLDSVRLVPHFLVRRSGFYMLPQREELVRTRKRRAVEAARLWPYAIRYGRIIAGLPFVRMVAVTGALAVDNVEPGADIDYLIVTEPGRLWLCRGLIVALVRIVARQGRVICPNYLITEHALELHERTLYTAHELAQMVPLAGLSIYHRIRKLNAWAGAFLPNASDIPRRLPIEPTRQPLQAIGEAALRTSIGGRIERWEMDRKLRKLSGQRSGSAEVAFCADWCKGHFEGHGQQTLEKYAERLRVIDEVFA